VTGVAVAVPYVMREVFQRAGVDANLILDVIGNDGGWDRIPSSDLQTLVEETGAAVQLRHWHYRKQPWR